MRKLGTENKESCSQRDSAERKGYVRAHRSFNRIWKERDSAEPDILSKILNKDNLNRAYKRVKANKGAPGIDGMTIEAALSWLKEHNRELTERIRRGKYTPSPVRRVEIQKEQQYPHSFPPPVSQLFQMFFSGPCNYQISSSYPLSCSIKSFSNASQSSLLGFQ